MLRSLPSEIWSSLAITAMWIVVAVAALWGPDFVSTSTTSATKIPSAIILGLFAWLGTAAIAKYGFAKRD